MMMAPQVVGVLLKKPGQQNHPRIPSLDRQETRIRGELYVENLGERRTVSIRMGWLWVEDTSMRLPLRALNLRQAAPSICQPHDLALGFTLSNSQGHLLATFWADTEPIYWSWVRAIATELVRQTPFRAQRCLNFFEILTICPRGPVPLPDSPTENRRRSRSELRCWPMDSPMEKNSKNSNTILEESRRRARSELRGWSSSNSSDEDLLGEFRSIPSIISKDEQVSRTWGCSESSEGSDDSLPWGGICRSSVDSVDSTVSLSEAETREQRIQRYKEARRRENEARSRRVLEEDARRRKARAEENNNDVLKSYTSTLRSRLYSSSNNNDDLCLLRLSKKESSTLTCESKKAGLSSNENCIGDRLPPVKPLVESSSARFEHKPTDDGDDDDDKNNNNNANNSNNSSNNGNNGNNVNARHGSTSPILKSDSGERRSRARERRNFREKGQLLQVQQQPTTVNGNVETLQERKERLVSVSSRIPIARQTAQANATKVSLIDGAMATLAKPSFSSSSSLSSSSTSSVALSILKEPPCQEDVAKLLERCQRVDHYVPVREKLTLFESLSRLGGRLARSTEDLGRSSAKPSPRGKQRARSLHDLNRGARAVPVKEMCRLFEGDVQDAAQKCSTLTRSSRFSDSATSNCGGAAARSAWKENANSAKNDAPCVRTSNRKKHYVK